MSPGELFYGPRGGKNNTGERELPREHHAAGLRISLLGLYCDRPQLADRIMLRHNEQARIMLVKVRFGETWATPQDTQRNPENQAVLAPSRLNIAKGLDTRTADWLHPGSIRRPA